MASNIHSTCCFLVGKHEAITHAFALAQGKISSDVGKFIYLKNKLQATVNAHRGLCFVDWWSRNDVVVIR